MGQRLSKDREVKIQINYKISQYSQSYRTKLKEPGEESVTSEDYAGVLEVLCLHEWFLSFHMHNME